MQAAKRLAILAGVVAAGVGAMIWARPAVDIAADATRLTYVTTAEQQGVVGYRDPVGAISRDGERLVFAEGRRLYDVPTSGGARITLAEAEGQIRHVSSDNLGAWIFEDTAASTRWWLASSRAPLRPLFGTRTEIVGDTSGDAPPTRRRANELRQIVSSPDGKWLAAVSGGSSGQEIWRIAADGSSAQVTHVSDRVAWPAWTPSGEIVCTVRDASGETARWRLSMPCGQTTRTTTPDREVIGPLAFETTDIFFATPTDAGFVELWAVNAGTWAARRVAGFSRDTYAPSTTADGRLLFKSQTYRTSVVEFDLASRTSQQLSTLQAETPSYHPDGRRIAVTYGTWRRVVDDAKYPDIAQEIGVIPSMPIDKLADAPAELIATSDSEDQAMTWSPNGKWIAFHSHREQSDDIWLRPVDKRSPDRRVSFLGRGAEVGWPRWSPNGRWILYDGASQSDGRSVMFVIGVDQETGEVTEKPREVAVAGFGGDLTHGEWLPDSRSVAAIGKDAPGRHVILTVPIAGGAPRIVHRFPTEHDFPGLAVSPDGRHIAFVAPATDGFYQIFRMPLAGGTPQQVTTDRAHKTQPAWSPDGRRIAYTVWSYIVQFWLTQ